MPHQALRAEVGSEQLHFHAAVLLAAIAGFVVGGRAGLSVTDGVHAEERELAIEGQIADNGSGTAPAELDIGRGPSGGVGEPLHVDGVVLQGSDFGGEGVELGLGFLAQLALTDGEQDRLGGGELVIVHVLDLGSKGSHGALSLSGLGDSLVGRGLGGTGLLAGGGCLIVGAGGLASRISSLAVGALSAL